MTLAHKGQFVPPVALRPGRSEQTAAAQAFGPRAPLLITSAPLYTSGSTIHPGFIFFETSEITVSRLAHVSYLRRGSNYIHTHAKLSGADFSLSPLFGVNPESDAPASAAKRMATSL